MQRRTRSHSGRFPQLIVRLLLPALLGILMVPVASTAPAAAQSFDPNVDRLYCAYFLREADAGGRAYWNDLYRNGESLEVIAEQFAVSEEFRNSYGAQQSTGDFVTLIYRNLFDRAPDAEGFAYWTNLLDTGQTFRGVVMTYFSMSQEFINRVNQLGCGATGGGGDGGNDGRGSGGTAGADVGQRLAALTDWTTPVLESADDRSLSIATSPPRQEAGSRISTTCRPLGMDPISRTFTEFPAYGFNGPTRPGLIVEGAGIAEGDLRVLPLDRAPATMVSNLDSTNNVRQVNNPTTSTIQTAVTALKRDADARLTGLDVVPSDISYVREEVHSFEQASLTAGVSLHYQDKSRELGFSLDRSQNDAVERHSIVVRFVQPMFEIEMERDGIVNPEDHFAASVSAADVDALRRQGRLTEENPPVLIDSVTYGRMMLFTMTSETATSASELEAAVNAAYGGISGQANLTNRQSSLLDNAQYGMLSYGGDQGLALSAIESGDLSSFFGPANTTTAAPLTMSLRTLDGTAIDVGDRATLQQVICADQAAPFQFHASIREIRNANAYIRVNGRLLKTVLEDGSGGLDIPADWLRDGDNTITFELRDGQGANGFNTEVISMAVWARGSSAESWGGPSWDQRYANNFYFFFDTEVTINTITGQVSGP